MFSLFTHFIEFSLLKCRAKQQDAIAGIEIVNGHNQSKQQTTYNVFISYKGKTISG